MNRSVGFRLDLERAFLLHQLIKPFAHFRERLLIESGAGVTDVNQIAIVVDPQENGAKTLPATLGLGKAADHCFLAHMSLDFEPCSAAYPLPITAVGFL